MGNFSSSDNENWYSHDRAHDNEEHDNNEDSAISLSANGGDRLGNGGESSLPVWRDTVLHRSQNLPPY